MYPHDLVEVFAARRAADCKERALVLRAQGIPFQRGQFGGLHRLYVPAMHEAEALAELKDYESENRDWPPRSVLPPALPGARSLIAGYAMVVGVVYGLAGWNVFGLGWRGAGAAHAEAIRSGELWRTITALTLHTGPVHALNNLVFGSLFAFLVAYTHGGGLGALAILGTGALGNLTNAWIQDPSHLSIGASTAVFGAVGLLGGSEWRRRTLLQERRLRVAAPVVGTLVLLAFHGVPADPAGVDVLAHVLGLAWGLVLGAALPSLLARGWGAASRQRLAAGLTLGLIALAWALAFLLGR